MSADLRALHGGTHCARSVPIGLAVAGSSTGCRSNLRFPSTCAACDGVNMLIPGARRGCHPDHAGSALPTVAFSGRPGGQIIRRQKPLQAVSSQNLFLWAACHRRPNPRCGHLGSQQPAAISTTFINPVPCTPRRCWFATDRSPETSICAGNRPEQLVRHCFRNPSVDFDAIISHVHSGDLPEELREKDRNSSKRPSD